MLTLEIRPVNLNEKEAARFLNCSVALLRRMRREHRGPRWVRIGGRLVRYPADWLSEYVDHNEAGRQQ